MAVIEEIRKRGGAEILYIGSKGGVESGMMEKMGVPYAGVHCGKLRRYFSWKNFVDALKVPTGVFQAYKALKEFSPDVVFSKGGYVAVPVVIAASVLKIPVISHESDVSPGLANKISFRFSKQICLSFEETKSFLSKSLLKKVVVTGNPVRESIFQGDGERGYRFTGLDKHRPVILVMGGSLGAKQINDLVRDGLNELLKRYQVVHIAGKGNLDLSAHKEGYRQYEFLDEPLRDIFAMSEMVVSRGGANSLFELALMQKKVLIIPLAMNASRGEQIANAQVFVRKFGWSMISGNISTNEFLKTIDYAFNNNINKSAKVVNGTSLIVDIINKFKK
jgi:UDP-N-acetylglucosamine--N-acetylmuramyl-(pentapeptide) pyrophosphoryl-undecaprenol N-acetylglucosamine transferase